MKIDAHQHFWKYNNREYGWMSESQTQLQRDFLPQQLAPELKRAGIEGTIAVQARQTTGETEWLLGLSEKNTFIKGVVGWVDLRDDHVEDELQRLTTNPRLRGVRHVLHDEPDDQFMLGMDFCRGISRLRQFNLTYDILVFPRHLPQTIAFVQRFPEQPFVLDHLAKPVIKSGTLSPWDSDMRELARFDNVFCKVSGMVTEASWEGWKYSDFVPYLDVVFEAFGPRRLMMGSDWPVCTVAGDYGSVAAIPAQYLKGFGKSDTENVLGRTCAEFYGLSEQPSATGGTHGEHGIRKEEEEDRGV